MPKVSIIVPVYNVAEYLRRCLDSCVCQTLADTEVIVVNDCSPDHRDEEIIRDYERDYPDKIRVFRHEKNLGLGEARNTAIRNAQGEFLLFCDSDDFLDFTACEKMYFSAKRNDADLVVCDFYYMRDGVIGMRHVNDGIDTVERSYRPCVLNKTTVWVMLLKKSVIVDNNLFSPFRFGEDNITMLWYLAAKKIAKVDEPLYYYVYRNSSLIGAMTSKSAEEMADVYLKVLQYDYFSSITTEAKLSICFLIFKRFFGYWLDVLLKDPETEFTGFFKRILEINSVVDNYRQDVLRFNNIDWEMLRANKIIDFAESHIKEADFNAQFRKFYSELDQQLICSALMKLKQRLTSKNVVLWASGSYGKIFTECLTMIGIEFEVSDLVAKGSTYKHWDLLKDSADIVIVSSTEFVPQVKKIFGDTEMIVLQKYLNESLRGEI
jgi:glycosyltransferase involved in cell wall biosynthesis